MTFSFSIGILAHNEANQIAKTLHSLRQQTVFQAIHLTSSSNQIEVVVVPNGCTDRTAEVADRVFNTETWTSLGSQVVRRVASIPEAGKSNAWNVYIHEISDRDARYIFLMDADIEFNEPETLERMLANLESKPDAWVAIDQPIKDVQFRKAKGIMSNLSAQVSDVDSSSTAITGQLYCGRSEILRQTWMPKGLAVEDGFLRAMILTNRFTGIEKLDRIAYTHGASHIYEAYTSVPALLKHEKRIIVGTIVNQFIFDYFWRTCHQGLDAGMLVKQNNEQDPQWVEKLIDESRKDRGWWLLNADHTFRRLENLSSYSGLKKIKRLPIEIAASLADWIVFYNANREVHRDRAIGYW
jgi:glycosyltransferase involved in cell wall biosynthesis